MTSEAAATTLPPDMLGAFLDSAPALAEAITTTIGPTAQHRDAIRTVLADAGMIAKIPDDPAYLAVGAVDGAYLVNPLAVGDHLASLAVAVRSERGGDVNIAGYTPTSDFWPHTADASVLLKAQMMGSELTLLSRLGEDCVSIIDGSHATGFIAINLALASADQRVRRKVLDRGDDLVAAAEFAVSTDQVVACPKSDSSMDLWEHCAAQVDLTGPGLTDKALASLVLDDGEMVVAERPVPSWANLYATQGQVSDPQARALAERLGAAVAPLGREPVRVHLAKPPGATVAVRIEVKGGVDPFEAVDLVGAVCKDCAPPHVQEPVSQYLADLFAKNVAAGAEMQRASALVTLAEAGTSNFDHLLANYRT